MDKNRLIKIGLLGFGTVGTGVVRFLQSEAAERLGLKLTKVAVSDPAKPREVPFQPIVGNVEEVLDDPAIDIVVELLGGLETAHRCLATALQNGKSVVTANKAVISRFMPGLFRQARDGGVDLAFEAAVAGSLPIIRILRGYRGQGVNRLCGILNGTSNYILTQMETGRPFAEALRLAQEKGFAEARHELDTGGFDARDKLAILASLMMDTHIDPEVICCEGILGITPTDLDFAAKHGVEEGGPGYVVKSLATAQRKGSNSVELHVFPALLRRDHPLASVRDEVNAIYIEGELSGPQLYQGRGAGREATSSAVISDLVWVAENRRRGVVDLLPSLGEKIRLVDAHSIERRGYIRMNLKHIPGSIAETSRILGEHGFNIEDSIQRRRFRIEVDGEVFIPDIITAEPLPFHTVRRALKALEKSNRIKGEPFYLRFEE